MQGNILVETQLRSKKQVKLKHISFIHSSRNMFIIHRFYLLIQQQQKITSSILTRRQCENLGKIIKPWIIISSRKHNSSDTKWIKTIPPKQFMIGLIFTI